MASDTGLFSGNIITSLNRKKIIRTPDGCLVASSGDASVGQEFKAWACGDRSAKFKPTSSASFTGVLVTPDGIISEYYKDSLPVVIDTPYYATGAGMEIGLGAMIAGASAEEAVNACIKHHIYCAGYCDVEALVVIAELPGDEIVYPYFY